MPSGVPPFSIVSAPLSIVGAVFDRFGAVFDRLGAVFDRLSAENRAKTIENGAETKHLNSTRTARPPRAWQFESNSNATEKKKCTIRSFVRYARSFENFSNLVRVDAIDLVQKSSNFEPSSRFFGRLKILNSNATA